MWWYANYLNVCLIERKLIQCNIDFWSVSSYNIINIDVFRSKSYSIDLRRTKSVLGSINHESNLKMSIIIWCWSGNIWKHTKKLIENEDKIKWEYQSRLCMYNSWFTCCLSYISGNVSFLNLHLEMISYFQPLSLMKCKSMLRRNLTQTNALMRKIVLIYNVIKTTTKGPCLCFSLQML